MFLSETKSSLLLKTSFGELILSISSTIYLPFQRVLCIADVHLGKAAQFRQLGVPVPSGTTEGNLQRLSAAIAAFKPKTLLFLGDLLHGPAAHNAALLDAIQKWRKECASIEMILVRGNHDSHAGDPPPNLGIQVVSEPYILDGFALCHHPQTLNEYFVLAGHIHPVVQLKGKGRDKLRLPCFVYSNEGIVLPAFGEFTGGYVVAQKKGQTIIPIAM